MSFGIKRFLSIIAVFAFLSVLGFAAELPIKDLDQSIDKALEDWNIAGLAIAIVKDGQVIHLKGYGYQNVNDKTHVDENTIFGIGSTSKAFGAATIGVLVHEGKLKWDDKVIDHLPGFQLSDPYVTRELTVRDLLCHRSGVETNDAIWFGSTTRDEIVYKARFLKQSSSLRSRFDYHNIMILTAGQVAAQVMGKPWDDIVREKIFQPLGMDRTCTSINDFDKYTNVSTPHRPKDGKLVPVPWLNIDNVGPAGSVNSCAADLAKWIQLHLNRGKFEGKEIWNANVQREMHSPQTIMSAQMTAAMLYRIAKHAHFGLYGLGWMMNDYRGKKFVYHSGATDGMGSFIGLVTEEKLGVAVIHNTSSSGLLSALAYRIIDAYLGVPKAEWMDLKVIKRPERPKTKAPKLPADISPSLPLESYTGVYTHPIFENIKVYLEGGNLVLDFDLYPTATLEHKYLDTFITKFEKIISSMWDRTRGHELEVTFHIDADAKVTEMSILGLGDFTRAKK
ncbi:serine hydrolase [Acidobacteriota bacterium]